MIQFLYILWRYAAAIVVAFVTSCVAWFLFSLPFVNGGSIALAIAFVFPGFVGVFFGTLALPQDSRRIGSIVLTLLGVGYAAWFFARLLFVVPDITNSPLGWIAALATGAALAVFLIWMRFSGNGANATDPWKVLALLSKKSPRDPY